MAQRWDITANDHFKNFCAHRTQMILAGKKCVVEFIGGAGSRTPTQNNCLHQYCDELATALNEAGYERRVSSPLLSESVEVPWCKDTVKSDLWHTVQLAYSGKESSTDLSTVECSQIYEIIHRHLAQTKGINVPWPTYENQ
jgi:hypothetical protein